MVNEFTINPGLARELESFATTAFCLEVFYLLSSDNAQNHHGIDSQPCVNRFLGLGCLAGMLGG